jgi:uncharacterized metal-binding protein
VIHCDLPGLEPGGSASIDVEVVPERAGATTLAAAEVRADQPEALPASNRQQVPVTVVGGGAASADPACDASRAELCLHGGRFRLAVEWRDHEDHRGSGTVVAGGSSDSGMFWFFDEGNWEMLVKVLDGCALNDRFWVLAAATTDVEYTLTVTDTLAGGRKAYRNELGQASDAIIDVDALGGCGEPASTGEPTAARVTASSRLDASLRAGWAERRALALRTGCGDTQDLCLAGGRFRVEVEWRNHEGERGRGQVVPFGSADSGLLWFFDEDNWEMLVKVLDGCALNGRYWVFSAATTDVEYTLRITDTETGDVREYWNPLGSAAAALTDTGAFATCR